MAKRLVKAIFVGPNQRTGGRLHRTGKLVWTGDPRVEGRPNTVGYAVAHIGGERILGVEKRFFRSYFQRRNYTFTEVERNLLSLSQLQKAGVPVVPKFWVALTKSHEGKLERSLFMTDLTERGKCQVYSSYDLNHPKVGKILRGLKNAREMWRAVDEAQGKALSLGYSLGGILGMDSWMFIVDPKTNKGRAVIADMDYHSPDKKFFEGDQRELGLAGIGREKMRGAIQKAYSILRRSLHPEKSVLGKLASSAGRFSGELEQAANAVVESDKERFEAIARAYCGIASMAAAVQIGGDTFKRHTSGLSKAQRQELYKEFIGTDSHMRKIYSKPTNLAGIFGMEKCEQPIYRIREKRRKQWNAAMIGHNAARILGFESERLGIPLFWHDSSAAEKFDELAQQVRSASSNAAARKLLSQNMEVVENKLLQSIAEQFGQDMGFLASLRTRKDLLPYSS